MPRKRREGGRNLTEEHCVNPLTLANFTQKPALLFKSMHPPSFRPANRIQKPKPDTQATPGSKCGKHPAMRPGGGRDIRKIIRAGCPAMFSSELLSRIWKTSGIKKIQTARCGGARDLRKGPPGGGIPPRPGDAGKGNRPGFRNRADQWRRLRHPFPACAGGKFVLEKNAF